MQNLTLYTSPQSRGTYVRWMLEECQAPYRAVAQPVAALQTAEYRAINPLGKVPALKVGDQAGEVVLTETLGIITWLAEQFPEKNLIPPAHSVARGEYYRWMCFALHLEYACVDKRRGIENSPEQRTFIGYGSFDEALQLFKTHLQGRAYIVGDGFTALDLYYSGFLAWMIHATQVLPPDAVFTDYMNRHLARPAFVKTRELDAADAAGFAA
ncbi:glutathione S-transferase [Lysobacteraceae bacterium NML120232]|nr:glutathione S-transferase [Xanthomonadaceae bacterium NML120232]